MSVRVQVTGLRELERTLRMVGEKMRKKILRKAMRKGALPIAKAARARAPRDRKHEGKIAKDLRGIALHRSIAVRSARKRRGGQEDLSVRVTATVPHAHLVEYGTGPRYHADGKYVGQAPAQPFMRPAFEETKGQAQAIVAREIAAGIEREVRKN